jgi:hypothetical protein
MLTYFEINYRDCNNNRLQGVKGLKQCKQTLIFTFVHKFLQILYISEFNFETTFKGYCIKYTDMYIR